MQVGCDAMRTPAGLGPLEMGSWSRRREGADPGLIDHSDRESKAVSSGCPNTSNWSSRNGTTIGLGWVPAATAPLQCVRQAGCRFMASAYAAFLRGNGQGHGFLPTGRPAEVPAPWAVFMAANKAIARGVTTEDAGAAAACRQRRERPGSVTLRYVSDGVRARHGPLSVLPWARIDRDLLRMWGTAHGRAHPASTNPKITSKPPAPAGTGPHTQNNSSSRLLRPGIYSAAGPSMTQSMRLRLCAMSRRPSAWTMVSWYRPSIRRVPAFSMKTASK